MKTLLETFAKVLAPFVPFLAEELWAMLGNAPSVHEQSWPQWDESMLQENTVEVAVQINGKFRAQWLFARASEEEVREAVMSSGNFSKYLSKEALQEVFLRSNKIINS